MHNAGHGGVVTRNARRGGASKAARNAVSPLNAALEAVVGAANKTLIGLKYNYNKARIQNSVLLFPFVFLLRVCDLVYYAIIQHVSHFSVCENFLAMYGPCFYKNTFSPPARRYSAYCTHTNFPIAYSILVGVYAQSAIYE